MGSESASRPLTDTFIAKGQAVLDVLDGERQKSFDAIEARKTLTLQVQHQEVPLSRLLAPLLAADEVVATENLSEEPLFVLNVICTEEARLDAAADARKLASSNGVSFAD